MKANKGPKACATCAKVGKAPAYVCCAGGLDADYMSRLRRRSLVAYPVREMVFARGECRTNRVYVPRYRKKAPSVSRTVEFGMFDLLRWRLSSVSAGDSSSWQIGVGQRDHLRVRSSFRKYSTGTYTLARFASIEMIHDH